MGESDTLAELLRWQTAAGCSIEEFEETTEWRKACLVDAKDVVPSQTEPPDVIIKVNGKFLPLYGTTLRYEDAVRMAGFSRVDGGLCTYSDAFPDENGKRSGILMPGKKITVWHRGTVINVAYTGNA